MEGLVKHLNLYRNKRVLVTGHTGFKGSWLVKILSEYTSSIVGYSLRNEYDNAHIDLINVGIESIIGDINDREKFIQAIVGYQPDVIFHLAAQPLVRASYSDPFNTYSTNIIGSLNLLDGLRQLQKEVSVVMITTDKVYENKEWDYPYRENDRLGGYDPYSSSKACCEILVESYKQSFFNPNQFNNNHQVLIATVRAGNVIGGGDWSKDRLIPDIVKATAKGDSVSIRNPLAIRPWQHVLDCLNGYLLVGSRLIERNIDHATAYNFAPLSQESKTVGQMTEIAKKYWKDIEIKVIEDTGAPHEAKTLKLDISKATSLLKWKPVWNTEQAIEKTISWYKDFHILNTINTEEDIKSFYSN